MNTEYQIPLSSDGKVSTSKLFHDLCATWSGIELAYRGLLSRPDMKSDYEELIRLGQERVKTMSLALKEQIEGLKL